MRNRASFFRSYRPHQRVCYVYVSAPFHLSHSCVASQGPLHETPILVGRETEGPLVDAPHP